ncbi:MAG: hypothetical protein ACP5KN_21225 [Armatimonadota bacterium]
MTRRQYYGALIVLAVSGLAGGALGSWLMPGRAAWAQEDGRMTEPRTMAEVGAAKEVRAERFVLVDGVGHERALLTTSLVGHAGPALSFWDRDGNVSAILGVVDPQPVPSELELAPDEEAKLRDSMRLIGGVPGPRLRFYDTADETGMALRMILKSEGLIVTDGNGVARIALSIFNGDPGLRLADRRGFDRVQLQTVAGEPTLALRDAAGLRRVVLGSMKTEDPRTGATIAYPISTITLLGETGHVRWQAP